MNKVKLACDLQSLSCNVIMLVLFTAAVIALVIFLVPVQWFLARKSYISLEGEGKLALFRTEDNVLLAHPSCCCCCCCCCSSPSSFFCGCTNPRWKILSRKNLAIKGNEQVEVMYGWAVSKRGLVRQECLVVNGTVIWGEILCLFFTSSVLCRRERHSAVWAVYSQTEGGFYLQVVFNSIHRPRKSFIKFVHKGLFCFRKNGSGSIRETRYSSKEHCCNQCIYCEETWLSELLFYFFNFKIMYEKVYLTLSELEEIGDVKVYILGSRLRFWRPRVFAPFPLLEHFAS